MTVWPRRWQCPIAKVPIPHGTETRRCLKCWCTEGQALGQTLQAASQHTHKRPGNSSLPQSPPRLHGRAREGAVGSPIRSQTIPRDATHSRPPGARRALDTRLRPPMRFAPRTWETPPPSDLPLPVLCAPERMPVADPSSYTACTADFRALAASRRHDDTTRPPTHSPKPPLSASSPCKAAPRQHSAALSLHLTSGVGSHSLASYTAITTMQ